MYPEQSNVGGRVTEPVTVDLRDAAEALDAAMNGFGHKASIAMGVGGLLVYVRGDWHGEQLKEWMGWPVEWHLNVGEARAYDGTECENCGVPLRFHRSCDDSRA